MFGYYLTPTKILELIKQVDGTGSQLDADFLRGNQPSAFATSAHGHTNATTSVAGFQSATDKTKLDGIAVNANNYSHPTGDGNLHVPATGTTNNLRLLKAGSTAGSLSWAFADWGEISNKPATFTPSAHNQDASTITTGVFDALRIPTLNQNTTGSAATLTTARTFTIGTTGKAFNGSANVAWSLTEIGAPSLSGAGATGTWGIGISGNAATATAWQTARTIALSGGVTGTATSINGTSNITIPVTSVDAGALSGTVADSLTSANTENVINTIVKRNSAGDIKCRLIRQEYVGDTGTNIVNIVTTRTPGVDTDNFLRYCTLDNFRTTVTDPFYWRKDQLPDIEEGTFSPSLRTVQSTDEVMWTSRKGTYRKQGNQVSFAIEMVTAGTLPSSSSQVVLTLPFSSASGYYWDVNIFQFSGFSISSNEWIKGTVWGSLLRMWRQSSSMSVSPLSADQMSGNSIIRINGVYLI